MWKQKIGIAVGNKLRSPDEMKMLADIGFDSVSPGWSKDGDVSSIAKSARECGMDLQYLHAPYTKASAMWGEDEEKAAAAKGEVLASLEDAARNEIPNLVVHTWIGFDYTFGETKYGFARYAEVVDRAAALGVRIAFENTEGDEYLFALMEHFAGCDTVGFCWDSGHELCYNHSRDLLADFGDRLLVTHLNDNLGISRFDGKTFWTDDLHLLPYDGIADWDDNIARLKKSRKLDVLSFELGRSSKPNRHENDAYTRMSDVEYYTEAYNRACRIAYRYAR